MYNDQENEMKECRRFVGHEFALLCIVCMLGGKSEEQIHTAYDLDMFGHAGSDLGKVAG